MDFEIIRGNIATVSADAIVLPANSKLEEGNGASKAIFEAAGRRKLTKACKEVGCCDVGNAVISGFGARKEGMQLAESLSPAQKLSHVEQKPAIPCQALKNRVSYRKKQVSPWWNTSGTGWLLFHPRFTWGQQKTQQESGVYRYLICMKFKMTLSMIL